MAIHKLHINDFVSSDYELIAINSNWDDYRLAFFLNKILHLKLFRDYDIELQTTNGKNLFSHFYFDDYTHDLSWHLISNKSEATAKKQNIGLFTYVETVGYFLPEIKNADFILKIENTDSHYNCSKTIQEIETIQGVITLFKIEQTKLKSKNNLIF